MKVDSVALPAVSNAQMNDLPIMNAEEIKNILYLGIKGEINARTGQQARRRYVRLILLYWDRETADH